MKREIRIPLLVGLAGVVASIAIGVSLGVRDIISGGVMISVAVMAALGALMDPAEPHRH